MTTAQLRRAYRASLILDLRGSAEAPEAGAQVEAVANELRAGRHDLSAELPSTMASAWIAHWPWFWRTFLAAMCSN